MFCAKFAVSTNGFNAAGLPQLRGKVAFLMRISMLGGSMSSFLEHNRQAWDERIRRRDSHTESAAEADFRDPLAAADNLGWLGSNVQGWRLLCLAAGGGKHGALFAAAGADVTVVDLSPAMLERDRAVAAQRGLRLRVVETSMTDLSMFAEGSFDAVVQPVSSCYVPDILAVYREVARITAPGGLYVSQHKQPACLQAEVLPSGRGYLLSEPYYRSGPLPPVLPGLQHREAGTVEFLHRWEDMLGGLCRSGFVIEDLIEPKHGDARAEPGTFAQRSHFVPPFVAVKARRTRSAEPAADSPRLWLPS